MWSFWVANLQLLMCGFSNVSDIVNNNNKGVGSNNNMNNNNNVAGCDCWCIKVACNYNASLTCSLVNQPPDLKPGRMQTTTATQMATTTSTMTTTTAATTATERYYDAKQSVGRTAVSRQAGRLAGWVARSLASRLARTGRKAAGRDR